MEQENICLIVNETSECIGYIPSDTVRGFIYFFVLMWGVYFTFKIILNQLK